MRSDDGGRGCGGSSGCTSASTSIDSVGGVGGLGSSITCTTANFSYYRPSSCSELLYGDVDPLGDASLSIRFDDIPDDDYDDFRSPAYGKIVIGGYTVRRREACLVVAAALLLVACVVLAACFSLGARDSSLTPQQVQLAHTVTTCRHVVCLQESARVVALVNRSVSPCVDMGSFACGGFAKAHPLAAGEAYVEALDTVLDRTDAALLEALEADADGRRSQSVGAATKVRRIYRSCVHDVTGVRQRGRPLLGLIRAAGCWSVTSADWSESTWNVGEAVRVASAVHGVDVFFGVRHLASGNRNGHDNSRPLLKLTYPIVHDRAYFLYGTSYEEKVVEAHRTFLNVTASLLMDDFADGETAAHERHRQSVRSFVADVAYMEHRLHGARLAATQSASSTDHGKEQIVTVGFLQRTFQWMNWLEFVRLTLPETVRVTNDTRVLLDCGDYLQTVSLVIESTPKRCLNNLLAWKIIREFVPFLSLDYQQALEDFRTQVHVRTRRSPPRLRCLHFLTNSAVRRALLSMLAGSESTARQNALLVEQMASDVREAFSDRQIWKDESSRNYVINKLNTIQVVPEMDILSDEGALDDFYSKLEVNDVYFDNVLRVRNFERRHTFEASLRVADDVDDTTESESSPSVILLPHHLTSAPFVDAAYPRFLLYGRLATLLTAELLRQLSNSSRANDLFSNMVRQTFWNECLWTGKMDESKIGQNRSSTTKSIENDQFIHQTLAVNIAARAFHLSREPRGAIKHDERLAGLEELSQEQGFYLAASQLHCEISDPIYLATASNLGVTPGHILITNTIARTKDFQSAFDCPEHKSLNELQKQFQ